MGIATVVTAMKSGKRGKSSGETKTGIQRRIWNQTTQGGGETTVKETNELQWGEKENVPVIEGFTMLDMIVPVNVFRIVDGLMLMSAIRDRNGTLAGTNDQEELRTKEKSKTSEKTASETRRRSRPGWILIFPVTRVLVCSGAWWQTPSLMGYRPGKKGWRKKKKRLND
jgi:hypothetical protein